MAEKQNTEAWFVTDECGTVYGPFRTFTHACTVARQGGGIVPYNPLRGTRTPVPKGMDE